MYYLIRGLCPTGGMGGHGFSIDLHPEFKNMIKNSGMTDESITHVMRDHSRRFLDSCGFNEMYDPDESVLDRMVRAEGDKRKLGPNARKLYSESDIRISWGEWGPEHISVPGNACGLDIDRNSMWAAPAGATLYPHNVDSWDQKKLLLITFCHLAETAYLLSRKD